MSEHAPLVVSGIAPAQFAALCEKARGAGIEMNGDTGTAEKFGVAVRWLYEPAAGQLTLEVVKTPFFVSERDAYARLEKMVAQSRA